MYIPVVEKKIQNAGHRSHESWSVDKGKPFHMEISVLLFAKRGSYELFEIVHNRRVPNFTLIRIARPKIVLIP